jgi:hypothetical protein
LRTGWEHVENNGKMKKNPPPHQNLKEKKIKAL